MKSLEYVIYYLVHAHEENARAYIREFHRGGQFTFLCPESAGITRTEAVKGMRTYNSIVTNEVTFSEQLAMREEAVNDLLSVPWKLRTESQLIDTFAEMVDVHHMKQKLHWVFLDFPATAEYEQEITESRNELQDLVVRTDVSNEVFASGDKKRVLAHVGRLVNVMHRRTSVRDQSIAINAEPDNLRNLFREAKLEHLLECDEIRIAMYLGGEHSVSFDTVQFQEITIPSAVPYHRAYLDAAIRRLTLREVGSVSELGDEQLGRVAMEQALLLGLRRYFPKTACHDVDLWKAHHEAIAVLDASHISVISPLFDREKTRVNRLQSVAGFLRDIGSPIYELLSQDIAVTYDARSIGDALYDNAFYEGKVDLLRVQGLNVNFGVVTEETRSTLLLSPHVLDGVDKIVDACVVDAIPAPSSGAVVVFEETIGGEAYATLAVVRLAKTLQLLRQGKREREAYGEGILAELSQLPHWVESAREQKSYAEKRLLLHKNAERKFSFESRALVNAPYDVLPGFLSYCSKVLKMHPTKILAAYHEALVDGAHKDPIRTFAGDLRYVRVAPVEGSILGLDTYLLFDRDGVGLEMFSLSLRPSVKGEVPIGPLVFQSLFQQRDVNYIANLALLYDKHSSGDELAWSSHAVVDGIALMYSGYSFGSTEGEMVSMFSPPHKEYALQAIDVFSRGDVDLLQRIGQRLGEFDSILRMQGSDVRFLDEYIARFGLDPKDFHSV